MFYTNYDSPVGKLLLAATERGLAGVYFENHRHFKGSDGWVRDDGNAILADVKQQLQEYFAGSRRRFELPLDISSGTPFQQQVWQALLDIPFGATASYGELARRIGKPAAVRAVGAANGRNPVSIIVPCHRVIAGSGALTGYAGGLVNKQALLELEAGDRLI
ncbi:methylated-DNA--[protein]-cysteine S-methyltransferase [Undibacterium sp. TJN25]|uniref:methylated-DNA--[protein]-cysteine S-methyltransferase n=1 Tax=Undibacterium sp. TJN25 TaxID=3413056 RepID=UPI003BF155DA